MNRQFDEFEDEEFESEEEAEAAGAYGDKDDYGFCPICGAPGDVMNVGAKQWVVCHDDKVKWRLGIGFFSLFQREKPAPWDDAANLLASYREVKPLREAPVADPPADPVISPITDDAEARFRRMMGE